MMARNNMSRNNTSKHSSFYCIGLNYKKANADIRGKFFLSEEAHKRVLEQASSEGTASILAVSTCNRTEIYGFAKHPFQLIRLLCDNTFGSLDEFQKDGQVYKNQDAITHLFRVGTGLESQILGDFEIIGQLKQSFSVSKQYGLVDAFLERLINSVIQASKRVKTETSISTGATSVAFAAVKYIQQHFDSLEDKNILLYGIGMIGRNTCDNLVKHTKNKNIVLINRTKNSAKKIAGKFSLQVKNFDQLQTEITKADILIVATGAPHPTITENMISGERKLLVLDLSVPTNVAREVAALQNTRVVPLDELSQITDKTIVKRTAQIPQAEVIIGEVKKEFNAWQETRNYASTMKALKARLKDIHKKEIQDNRKKIPDFNNQQADILSEKIIQKTINHFGVHLKENPSSQSETIALISEIFNLQIKTND